MEWSLLSIALIPAGIFMGIIFGGLPGFAASTGTALMMPFSFIFPPFEGLVFLLCLYIGAVYGGSIPAILLSVPGAPGASGLLLDGYPMAKNGQPVQALTIATVCSVVGSIISIILFILIAPVLSRFALRFGPPEMFWVAIWGLSAAVAVKRGQILKGFFAGLLGLIFGTIGADPIMAQQRISFGILELYQGVPFIPALVGLFCFSEMVLNLQRALKGKNVKVNINTKQVIEGIKMVIKNWKEVIRGPIIGTVVGILPGAGASIAAFISYNISRIFSKHPEKYGSGIPEGVIAPSSADNATVGGALIPMMTLGIPGSAATAILLGFMMYHGLRPGARLFMEQWNLLKNLSIAMIIGSLVMGVMGLIFSRYSSLLTKINYKILAPSVLVLTTIATISVSGNINNIIIMFAFGLLGIILKIYDYPVTSMVLGIILGPIAEKNLLQSLRMSSGNYLILFTRPMTIVLICLCIVSVAYPYYSMKKMDKKNT